MVRRCILAARIASTVILAKRCGSTVSSGLVGSILVSMLKRTQSLPDLRTSANSSFSVGMRVPGMAR